MGRHGIVRSYLMIALCPSHINVPMSISTPKERSVTTRQRSCILLLITLAFIVSIYVRLHKNASGSDFEAAEGMGALEFTGTNLAHTGRKRKPRDEISIFAALESKRLPDGNKLLWDPQIDYTYDSPELALSIGEEEPDIYELPPSTLAKLDDGGLIDAATETKRCQKYGFEYDARRKHRRRLFFGGLIADESFNILQTVATEMRDVFHTVAFIESNSTQSHMDRSFRFPPYSTRRSILDRLYGDNTTVTVDYVIVSKEAKDFNMNLSFTTMKRQILMEHELRQPVLERWQRNGMRLDDVAIFGDTDEMFTRDFLRALQTCDVPEFRPGQDCKSPKILGRAHIFEASPECIVGNVKLWKPDAMIGECVDGTGDKSIHPPPKRLWGRQNFRAPGHGYDGNYDEYFASHGSKAITNGKRMYPLWTPADFRGIEGGRQVPKEINAFHLHNFFSSGQEIRDKYFKYAENLPRAQNVPLGVIHEDIALSIACLYGTKDLGKSRKLQVGGYASLDPASTPILYQDEAFRKLDHSRFRNLVLKDESAHGHAIGACENWNCDGCSGQKCMFAFIASYRPPGGNCTSDKCGND